MASYCFGMKPFSDEMWVADMLSFFGRTDLTFSSIFKVETGKW